MFKTYALVLGLLLGAGSLTAQTTVLRSASQQMSYGGFAARQVLNYEIRFDQPITRKPLVADTLWVKDHYFVFGSMNGEAYFRLEGEGQYRLYAGLDLTPNLRQSPQKPAPVPVYDGAGLFTYHIGRKHHRLVIPAFVELPELRMP